jgi:hypothetical protein
VTCRKCGGKKATRKEAPTDEELFKDRIIKYVMGVERFESNRKHPGRHQGINVRVMDQTATIVLGHEDDVEITLMSQFMRKNGYHLLNVFEVDFEFSPVAREFWWVKGR